ncbi:MAG: NAD-dependent epimerase/dehydratase family protein [Nitrospirae bacterium]|nr:NAD-dependent epimerase/dehydratase family protein [Nitrospirota bacterium]
MRALVTGGTGFIGSHLVEALLKRGDHVRCLVRDPDRPKWLKGLDVELVRGDCADRDSLRGVTEGMDYVFHAAGLTKAVRPEEYYTANGDGTRNIAEAAARDGAGTLRKFVLVSSQAAMGPSRKGEPRQEDDPPEPVSDYGKSKLAAETYALGYRDRMDVVIVRPTSVYGPRDTDIFTFFKMVKSGIRTTFKDERQVSLCYVDDLVDGILAAAFGDTRSGEAFFIAEARPYTWDEIGLAFAEAVGTKPVRVVLPVPLMAVVAVISEAVSAFTGRPALLNRQKIAEIRQRYWVVDVTRANERLGFNAVHGIADGAKITADWYKGQSWL